MADPPAIDPALLEAGRRALRAHGWAATTAERIAAEAGISRVTLHRRGIRRDDVLAALAALAVAAYREALWPALVAEGSGRSRLELALQATLTVAEEHLDVLVALQAASDAVFHALEAPAGEPVATRSDFTDPLERLLRDGARDGTLRPVEDPRETATVVFNAVGFTYLHLRTGHQWPPERAARGTLDLALRGLVA